MPIGAGKPAEKQLVTRVIFLTLALHNAGYCTPGHPSTSRQLAVEFECGGVALIAYPPQLHCNTAESWFSMELSVSLPRLCMMQAITHLDFSSNGRQLAVGSEGGSVALVACMPWRGGQPRWELIGHQAPHRTHTPLAGLAFGEAPSGMTKLFSISQFFRPHKTT